MRKVFAILIICALIIGTAVGAEKTQQEYRYGCKGVFGTARVSYIMWAKSVGFTPAASAEIIYGYSFNPWFMLGGGVGVTYSHFPKDVTSMGESRGAIRVPVYLHLRTNILDRKVSPFIAVNLGGGFCKGYLAAASGLPEVEDNFELFIYGEPQVGVALRLKGGKMVDFGVSVPLYSLDGGIKFGVGFTW